jgi:hypothetical protein
LPRRAKGRYPVIVPQQSMAAPPALTPLALALMHVFVDILLKVTRQLHIPAYHS